MRRWWTKSAIMCYKRGCICKGCFYEHFFTVPHFRCRMKQSVMNLVKFYGKPTKGVNIEDE